MRKISAGIYKIKSDSNVYFLDFKKKIIIDTAKHIHKHQIEKELKTKIDPKRIDLVIFTHLHYDHIGNADMFPNAAFYASKTEIEVFRHDPFGAILNMETVDRFTVELQNIEELDLKQLGLEVIPTPGHTVGSICLWYAKGKILFSGDTIFENNHGRVDLPTSAPKDMMQSLIKLKNYLYKVLCPGHDY